MSQEPVYRVTRLLTNAVRLGTAARGNAGAQKNHFIRADWGTNDRFRGVMGYYLASNTLYNVSDDSSTFRPLHTTEVSSVPLAAGSLGAAPATVDTYLLEPDNTTWNQASIVSEANNLLRKYIQDPGINEGDPYYSFYLEEGMPAEFGSVAPVFNNPGTNYFDHTFAYLKPSEDMVTRLSGGLEIEAEPVYNVFLDTMPTYESVTQDVPEMILPNFYVFEAELRNTGSTAYTTDYYKMITLYADNTSHPHRITDWFVDNNNGGYTETTSKSYYQTYVTSLAAIKASEANYNALQVQFTDSTRNIVVLNSDVDAITRLTRGDGETSGLSFLPFYNMLRIGHDEYRASLGGAPSYFGQDYPTSEPSFFASLYDITNFDAESFIDLLQMYIIRQIEQTNELRDFAVQSSGAGSTASTLNSTQIRFCTGDSLSRNDIGFISEAEDLADRVSTNITAIAPADRDNLVLLRDYADEGRWTTDANDNDVFDPPNPLAVNNFYTKVATGDITLPQRNWDQVIANEGAFSETLLYKVDKYVVDLNGTRGPTPVQTLYLSPRIVDSGDLQYVDSQVRYGVRYEYDIQQIRIVFGNRYNYDDLQIYFAGYAGYGRAVGNALGFYRPTVPQIKADNYVAKAIRVYYNDENDIGMSGSQNGYFALDPSNAGDITAAQWDYMASGSAYGEDEKLNRAMLIFKRGYGFQGNPSGGAVGGALSAPSFALPSGQAGAAIPLPGRGDSDIVVTMTGPAAGGGPSDRISDLMGGSTSPGGVEETNELFGLVDRAGQMAGDRLLNDMTSDVGGGLGLDLQYEFGGSNATGNPLGPGGPGGFGGGMGGMGLDLNLGINMENLVSGFGSFRF